VNYYLKKLLITGFLLIYHMVSTTIKMHTKTDHQEYTTNALIFSILKNDFTTINNYFN